MEEIISLFVSLVFWLFPVFMIFFFRSLARKITGKEAAVKKVRKISGRGASGAGAGVHYPGNFKAGVSGNRNAAMPWANLLRDYPADANSYSKDKFSSSIYEFAQEENPEVKEETPLPDATYSVPVKADDVPAAPVKPAAESDLIPEHLRLSRLGRAFVYSEIFGPPKGLRQEQS